MIGGMGDFLRPFRGADHGVTGHRRAKFQRLLRGVYVDPAVDVTARVKAEAAWEYCQGSGVLGGGPRRPCWGCGI
ncbi:hypothetical protein [Tomitella biformata]|uniref:hypothetical protein n=1 Tax=Tomitella biformata TaxID=630403 RepID=UPI00046585E1|nr:hypothetical protein [Tomitella biformata]